MILAIDFGSSTTNAVLVEKGKVVKTTSDKKEIQKLLKEDINQIKVTGQGAANFLKYPFKKIDEIKAIGKGGLHTAKKKTALVVSIGSGTAMVSCKRTIKHIGGTPIGGRTLTGLAKLLINETNLEKIGSLVKKGNPEKIDLTLKEIYPKGIGILPKTATASHFGNIKKHDKNDIALALLNMLAQSIATIAVFAAKAESHKNIIITGAVTKLPLFRSIIRKRISTLSNLNIIFPKNAEYATAIGAAIS